MRTGGRGSICRLPASVFACGTGANVPVARTITVVTVAHFSRGPLRVSCQRLGVRM